MIGNHQEKEQSDAAPPKGVSPMSDCIKKRGLYRTGNNWCVNADCNGTANIIAKVSTKAKFRLKPTV